MELRKVKPKHERLLESLLEEDKPVTAQSMLAYNFIPSSWTKKIIEYVELAQELSSEKGYIWSETKRKGVTFYQVHMEKQKEKEELDAIEADGVKKAKDMSEEDLLAFLNE